MKEEGQIKQKVKQVIFRHRKAYVKQGMARYPVNCTHNETVHLPVHMSNRATLRICQYCPEGEGPRNVVCDSTMGGDHQAEECPYFETTQSAMSLKEEFNRKLGLNGGAPVHIGYIAKEYPDIAALMWVLGPDKNADSQETAFFSEEDEELGEPIERPLIEEPHES